MKSNNANAQATPSIVEVFLTDFLNFVFAPELAGGSRRRWLLTLLIALVWAFAGYITVMNYKPPVEFQHILVLPFYALFSARVFRHVLIFLLIMWLSLQLAAHYLSDVFELSKRDVSEKYLIQAAFASQYDTISIKNGKIAIDDKESPIYLIGGPGLVNVHLDNVALFEHTDGIPHVIGPTKSPVALDRFERLRKIVVLRDHIVKDMNAKSRTKDGIMVIAEGARTKFSIDRGGQEPTLSTPYPFSSAAVETLVYGETKSKKFSSQADTTPIYDEEDELLKLSEGFINSQLQKFIASSKLDEFLAFEGEEDKSSIGDSAFVTRDQITSNMYDSIDENARKQLGLELYWIDIGTWVLPEEASKIPQQHAEAWQLSLDNLSKDNEKAYTNTFEISKDSVLSEIIQEILLVFHLQRNKIPPSELAQELALVLRQKLHRAKDFYADEGTRTPEKLDIVFRHFEEVSGGAHYYTGQQQPTTTGNQSKNQP
jgi:hypothetical protein